MKGDGKELVLAAHQLVCWQRRKLSSPSISNDDIEVLWALRDPLQL